jgi:hypothetical protein
VARRLVWDLPSVDQEDVMLQFEETEVATQPAACWAFGFTDSVPGPGVDPDQNDIPGPGPTPDEDPDDGEQSDPGGDSDPSAAHRVTALQPH